MTAAIYVRVSTTDQTSANQEPECRRLCEARGWDPLVIRDVGSGTAERPGWTRVLELARRGEVRAVVIWSLDRVGRRMYQVLRDVHELARVGCTVVSVRETWLDTDGPARDLLLTVLAWVAQHEHERLRERTRAGLDRARAAGKRVGRTSRLNSTGVARAAELRAQGLSWGRVLRQLEAEGWKGLSRGLLQQAVAKRAPVLPGLERMMGRSTDGGESR